MRIKKIEHMEVCDCLWLDILDQNGETHQMRIGVAYSGQVIVDSELPVHVRSVQKGFNIDEKEG